MFARARKIIKINAKIDRFKCLNAPRKVLSMWNQEKMVSSSRGERNSSPTHNRDTAVEPEKNKGKCMTLGTSGAAASSVTETGQNSDTNAARVSSLSKSLCPLLSCLLASTLARDDFIVRIDDRSRFLYIFERCSGMNTTDAAV